jgi:hypothetical protein
VKGGRTGDGYSLKSHLHVPDERLGLLTHWWLGDKFLCFKMERDVGFRNSEHSPSEGFGDVMVRNAEDGGI